MEYMDGGDLHGFLKNIKGSLRLSHSDSVSLQEAEKLDIGYQVAQGLEFLAGKKVLRAKLSINFASVLTRRDGITESFTFLDRLYIDIEN